jgi:bifunctional UDP-N-acetylglucosamine pyrophosphorylase / glucosamine-1-phosphate N-acetyltransferase
MPMNQSKMTAIILAAGKGTRMKSRKAKVLHELFFKPMIHHVVETVMDTGIEHIAVVMGHQREQVQESLIKYPIISVIQEEQLGTGHAVLCAEAACSKSDEVLILCGDTPLLRPEVLQAMIQQHRDKQAQWTIMTTFVENPFGYGRILSNAEDQVVQIVEEKDANAEERAIQEINAGVYLVQRDLLFQALRQVGKENSQGEIYLTDTIKIAVDAGVQVEKFSHSPALDVLGINSRVELGCAHTELQLRRNHEIMLQGVTIYSSETTLVSPASVVGQDCVIQAGVQISGQSELESGVFVDFGAVLHNCRIGKNAVIGANSVLYNCVIEEDARVPPLTCRTELFS